MNSSFKEMKEIAEDCRSDMWTTMKFIKEYVGKKTKYVGKALSSTPFGGTQHNTTAGSKIVVYKAKKIVFGSNGCSTYIINVFLTYVFTNTCESRMRLNTWKRVNRDVNLWRNSVFFNFSSYLC